MKHNKKRNTAFIYEAIIRELAKAIHEGDKPKKSKIIKIIRENFKGNTLLGKDLDLYKSILETKEVDQYTAEKIVFQSRIQKNSINHRRLFEKQSNLIEKINKDISPDVFFKFCSELQRFGNGFSDLSPENKDKKPRFVRKTGH
jgi:hypothetical protein